MKTTISRREGEGGVWLWCSTSSTATIDDPLRDHAADLGDDVYSALESAWEALGPDDPALVEIEEGGETYRLHLG
jgi:hypothetical protein